MPTAPVAIQVAKIISQFVNIILTFSFWFWAFAVEKLHSGLLWIYNRGIYEDTHSIQNQI